jgi:hypothetical protein
MIAFLYPAAPEGEGGHLHAFSTLLRRIKTGTVGCGPRVAVHPSSHLIPYEGICIIADARESYIGTSAHFLSRCFPPPYDRAMQSQIDQFTFVAHLEDRRALIAWGAFYFRKRGDRLSRRSRRTESHSPMMRP